MRSVIESIKDFMSGFVAILATGITGFWIIKTFWMFILAIIIVTTLGWLVLSSIERVLDFYRYK